MKIQIWSDIACPFCYIGKRRLEQALATLSVEQPIEIVYRSFELDPNAPTQTEQDIYTQLANKYRMSLADAKNMTNNVVKQAKSVDLDFYFDGLIPVNTFDAHRLLHLANRQGLMSAMSERLFKAFFTESLNVADHDTLVKLAGEIGLDRQQVQLMLASTEYCDDVRSDEQMARKRMINSVPFFIFDDKYSLSGAQPSEVFIDLFAKIDAEKIAAAPVVASGDAGCTDGVCSI